MRDCRSLFVSVLRGRWLPAVLAGAVAVPLAAQDPGAPKPEAGSAASHPASDYHWETGKVTVQAGGKAGAGVASIDLPEGWRYLQQREARQVVERDWGNPPNPDVLGLVVPPGEPDWAIIVSFDASGYVSDGDAAGLDYSELLASMKADTKEANAQRKKRRYPTVELLGWAEPPHYDANAKKIYWAKSLMFEGAEEPTLNYCVRILAADGVLEMNAVAKVAQLTDVAAGSKQILQRSELAPGRRYSEHNPSLHKVAAYGIGGLMAARSC